MINPSDLDAAKKVLHAIDVLGLAKFTGGRDGTPDASKYTFVSPSVTDAKQPAGGMNYKDPLQFWEILSAVINENPPPKDPVTSLDAQVGPLGIELVSRGTVRSWSPSF